jgi:HAD superfamily hydrolase (TIGR01549 family)
MIRKNMELSKVKYIAFDFCGTLADIYPSTYSVIDRFVKDNYKLALTKGIIDSAIQNASKEMPYSSITTFTEASRLEYFIQYNSRILHDLGGNPTQALELYRLFKNQDRHWQLKPEVNALLEELKARGYHLILASNFDSNLGTILRRLEIQDFFCSFFVSAAIGVEKPSLQFYELIVNTLECKPQEIVMVGDDLNLDVFPSMAVGLQSVYLEGGGPLLNKKKNLEYNNITTLAELLDIFK